jgi:AraC-like DNA-binding protein
MEKSSVQSGKPDASKIPKLIPSQFDDYLFAGWKAPNAAFYNNFHVERVENYRAHLQLPIPPHRRSVCFFVLLTAGRALRSKALTQYELLPGHIFCLPADLITSLEDVSEDAEGFYCHFTPEIFGNSVLNIELAHDFPFFHPLSEPMLKLSETERIFQLLHILETEYLKSESTRFELIPIYLAALFLEIRQQTQNRKEPQNVNAAAFLTKRYLNALPELVYSKKTVTEFAEHLAVTPNHLHKCVKATTGKTAHELLADMRILEAKVLLKQSRLSIGEIAFKIGELDASDFCRFFKSRAKMTPNQYRHGSL